MDKRFLGAAAAAACLFFHAGAVHAQAPAAASAPVGDDNVVLRAGAAALSKAEYEKLVLGFDRTSGATLTGASPQSVRSGQEVARVLALAEEAKRRGIDRDPEVAALIRVRGYALMANALFAKLREEARKDEAGTRALWETKQNEFVEISARQILVRYKGVATNASGSKGLARTEAQAKAVATKARAQVAAGSDFAAVAKTYSDDDSTRALGGQLPAFTRGAMQSEFEKVAFNLPPGGLSEPFKTKFGYHVVQVVERRPFAFEKVRATLEFTRAREAMEKIGSTGIDLNPAYFKP